MTDDFSDQYMVSLKISFDERIMWDDKENPDEWVQPFHCEIVVIEVETDQREDAGDASGWVVPFYIGDKRISTIEGADADSESCLELVSAVIDVASDNFKPDLDLLDGNILCVNQVKVLPKFRGRKIGLAALWHIIDRLGQGCAVVVIKPHPVNCGEETGENQYQLQDITKLSEKELSAAKKGLANYWRELGFKPVPKSPGYFYFNMTHRRGKAASNRLGVRPNIYAAMLPAPALRIFFVHAGWLPMPR